MVQTGFSLQQKYALPTEQVIELLKKAGFSAVSPVYSSNREIDLLAKCVDVNGMQIQSIHAPHGVSHLWQPDLAQSEVPQKRILQCVDACAEYGVPIMVIHGWQGLFYTFPSEPLNFRFFDKMVDRAEQKGVSVAFENLEGEEYLDALMTRYADSKNVGFCWDSGHDHCYPHKMNFLEAFGHRLIMTHLNDNLGLRDPSGVPSGLDDLHFLPFDGTVDWEKAVEKLKNMPRQKILNFEIKVRSHSTDPKDLPYEQMTAEQFFELAGIRARRIADMYERAIGEKI